MLPVSRVLIVDNVLLLAMSSVSGSGRLFPQPRVPLGVDAGVVGIQVDKAPLYIIRTRANVSQSFASPNFPLNTIFSKTVPCAQHAVPYVLESNTLPLG